MFKKSEKVWVDDKKSTLPVKIGSGEGDHKVLMYFVQDRGVSPSNMRLPISPGGDREDFVNLTLVDEKTIDCSQDQMFFCRINKVTRVLSIRNAMTIAHADVDFAFLNDKGLVDWAALKSITPIQKVIKNTVSVSPGMFKCMVIGKGRFLVCESPK